MEELSQEREKRLCVSQMAADTLIHFPTLIGAAAVADVVVVVAPAAAFMVVRLVVCREMVLNH